MAAAFPLMGAGMLSGCSDFLEVDPQNVITLEQFWNDANDVESIIIGCYTNMASTAFLSRAMIWGEFRSENVINNGPINDDVNLERILKENIMANNAYTDWTIFYKIINDCNTVMEYAPGVAAKDPSYTQSQLLADIAEATAIRSLAYFYLIRTFRDVPYYETAYLDDSQELALSATPFEEVLDHLIASLESVQENIILKNSLAATDNFVSYYDYFRITRPAVWAMLSEMYLWKKDYNKCIEYADKVINRRKQQMIDDWNMSESNFKRTNGYPLITDQYSGYANMYGYAFGDIFVNGPSLYEGIFEIGFLKGDDNSASNGPASDFYGGIGRTPWVTYTTFVGGDQPDGLYQVFSASNKGLDARAYENMNIDDSYINKFTSSGEVMVPGGTADAYKGKTLYSSQYNTYGNDHVSRNKSNWIIYRMSDVMLLKAEALTQLMSDNAESLTGEDLVYRDRAFDIVNAVNKRSLMQAEPRDTLVRTDYASKSSITNLVYEERHRELMFEGKRFFDLVRRSQRDGNTDYLRSHAANKSIDIKSVIESKMQKMDAIYWPYNLDELKANPLLKQNSAFGSGENSSYEVN